jgi:hypothetical protein
MNHIEFIKKMSKSLDPTAPVQYSILFINSQGVLVYLVQCMRAHQQCGAYASQHTDKPNKLNPEYIQNLNINTSFRNMMCYMK